MVVVVVVFVVVVVVVCVCVCVCVCVFIWFSRQFTDNIGESTPTYVKSVHRQNNIWEYQKEKE